MVVERVRVADHKVLSQIAWNYADIDNISGAEAIALYERNWRHVDIDAIVQREKDLIAALIGENVTGGYKAGDVIARAWGERFQSDAGRPEIYSIGHSNVDRGAFIDRLVGNGITAIADVRSVPASSYAVQFNKDELSYYLKAAGIAYVHIPGLGGRPAGHGELDDAGVADYTAIERSEVFRDSLNRVLAGASKFNLAMMCSEHDPVQCHRCLMVGRYLADNGIEVQHFVRDRDMPIGQFQIEEMILNEFLKSREGKHLALPDDQACQETLEHAYDYFRRKYAFKDKAIQDEVKAAAKAARDAQAADKVEKAKERAANRALPTVAANEDERGDGREGGRGSGLDRPLSVYEMRDPPFSGF